MKISKRFMDLSVVTLVTAAILYYAITLYGYHDGFCNLFALPVAASCSVLMLIELGITIFKKQDPESAEEGIQLPTALKSPRLLFGLWVIVFYLLVNHVSYLYLSAVFCIFGPLFCGGKLKDCLNWKWILFSLLFATGVYFAFTKLMYTAIL